MLFRDSTNVLPGLKSAVHCLQWRKEATHKNCIQGLNL